MLFLFYKMRKEQEAARPCLSIAGENTRVDAEKKEITAGFQGHPGQFFNFGEAVQQRLTMNI